MPSVRQNATRGVIWIFAGFTLNQSIRLAANLLLTRLLVPDMFGLMALVNVFIMGLQLFSDIGIGPSIIQNRKGESPEFYNTAWTIQVMRGAMLWLGSLILAWPISLFYGKKELLWLIPIVAFSSVISGFNSTSLFILNRRIAIARLTLLNLCTQICSTAVIIAWAVFSPTIWALVAGSLISSLTKSLLSHRLMPEMKNRFAWNRSCAREIFSFGKWIFISTAMTFLASQSDKLIMGKLFTFKMLGIFTIALFISDIPKMLITRISNIIIFPVISKFNDLPRKELRIKILRKRRIILIGLGILVMILTCFGDLFILRLYDKRYAQAAWMLPVLAIGIWPYLLSLSINKALFAIGKPRYHAYGNFLKFIYIFIGLPMGFYLWGIPGAVAVVASNDIPLYISVNHGLRREGLSGIRQDIHATLLLVICIAAVCWMRIWLGFGHPFSQIP
ncbi:MAG: oligosaccharide flippase family protein [Deltaproteobacteria bacterium]|nr:oligosaccharide flippase family protein [Deltaproteobacteria bacterium]